MIGMPAATTEPNISEQDHDGDGDADQLGRAALGHRGQAGAVDLGDQATGAGVGHGVLERVDGRGFDVSDGVDVEGEGDGADPAVLRQRRERAGVRLGLGLVATGLHCAFDDLLLLSRPPWRPG